MIKALIGDGVWLLGLSEENLRRLRAGNAVEIDFLGLCNTPAKKILIFSGRTEAEMKRHLEPFITKDTRIHGDEH